MEPAGAAARVFQQAVADHQAATPNVAVNVNRAGCDLRKLVIPAISIGLEGMVQSIRQWGDHTALFAAINLIGLPTTPYFMCSRATSLAA